MDDRWFSRVSVGSAAVLSAHSVSDVSDRLCHGETKSLVLSCEQTALRSETSSARRTMRPFSGSERVPVVQNDLRSRHALTEGLCTTVEHVILNENMDKEQRNSWRA